MRALILVLVVGLVAAVGTGCAAKRDEVPQMEPADLTPAPVATVTTPPSPAVVVETPGPGRVAVPSKAGASDPSIPAGATTHTVVKGDTLYSLARKFYGNSDAKSRTKILDANKAKIKDPNVLPVGAVLAIPAK
jgi:nucleoid-associated protein YgaU